MSGSVFVQFDKPFYFAGDTVTGTVYLNIQSQFPGNTIKLKVKGWETAIWVTQQHIPQQQGQPPFQIPQGAVIMDNDDLTVSEETSDSSDSRERSRPGYIRKGNEVYRVQRHAGRREFMKTKLDLYTWESGYINPGGYSFPFSFMLNPEWPGTFSFKQRDKKARIKYEVKCTCSFPSDKKREFCYRSELIVRERLQEKIKNQIKETTAEVTSCCCCSNGICKIKVFFEKDALCLGEKVRMTQELDCSQLKVNCTSIAVRLVQSVQYRDDEGQAMGHSIVKFTKSFGGLPAGQALVGDRARFEEFVLENQGSAQRGLSIMPSVTGRLVESSYSMVVEAVLDASCTCCSDMPVVGNPVFIYAQDIQAKPFIPPSGWQPQVMPVKTIPVGGNVVGYGGQQIPANQLPQMQPQGGYPPQQQQGYPPQQQPGYPPQQQQGYPPQQQPGYPPQQQQGYPPQQQPGYPPQQQGFPPQQQQGYPPQQQQGYPPQQQQGYPPQQQQGYPPQQQGYATEQQMQQQPMYTPQ